MQVSGGSKNLDTKGGFLLSVSFHGSHYIICEVKSGSCQNLKSLNEVVITSKLCGR